MGEWRYRATILGVDTKQVSVVCNAAQIRTGGGGGPKY
jgi:hypothetical protein